jgi:hypothetical protein
MMAAVIHSIRVWCYTLEIHVSRVAGIKVCGQKVDNPESAPLARRTHGCVDKNNQTRDSQP